MTALLAAAVLRNGRITLVDEAVEFFPGHKPACLAVDLKAVQCSGPEITTDCLDAQMQFSRNLIDGQESLSTHRRHVTKNSTTRRPMVRHVAKNRVE